MQLKSYEILIFPCLDIFLHRFQKATEKMQTFLTAKQISRTLTYLLNVIFFHHARTEYCTGMTIKESERVLNFHRIY